MLYYRFSIENLYKIDYIKKFKYTIIMSNFEQVNDSDDEDMVTCSNCGRCWDGYAQCCCYGIPIDEDTDDEEPEPEIKTRSHTMTLRSHVKDTTKNICGSENKQQTIELKHPTSWNPHTHYGQCGQSCPCCRAIVGDKWGACSICIKY